MARTTTNTPVRFTSARTPDGNGRWALLRNGKAVKRFRTRAEAREAARTATATPISIQPVSRNGRR